MTYVTAVNPRNINNLIYLACFQEVGIISGGEGGIRTPDTLASTSDFESGAFNQALPPLRTITHLISMS